LNERNERSLRRSQEAKAHFLASLVEAGSRQKQVLRRCLSLNADSRFGREHGFSAIDGIGEYRRRVPIRSYAEMEPWISQAAAGGSKVLTTDEPILFFTSSGSTGNHKKVPVTAPFMKECFLPFAYAAMGNFFEYFPATAERDDATLSFKWDPQVSVGATASGRPYLGASQVDYGKTFGEELAAEPGTRAPWAAPPADVTAHLDRIYYRVRLAAERDLRALIGINPAVIAALPQQVERWSSRLIDEIRRGTVLGRPLEGAMGGPNPARADELAALASYFGGLAPMHLWPRLEVIFCWTGAAASIYLPALQRWYGPRVQIVPAPVAASESPIAVPVDRHPGAGVLVVPWVFLEFADADREIGAQSRTCGYEELRAGGDYQVIVTHCGGLYRYAIGDVVRVVDHHAGVPRVEFVGRAKQVALGAAAVGEWRLVDALRGALHETGLAAANVRFHVVSDATPRVAVALEPAVTWRAADAASLARALDGALRRAHPAYERARLDGQWQAPAIVAVAAGTFVREWEERVRAGTRPAQVKDRLSEADASAWARLIARAEDN
jgi:GH3 auxin-responsive promoter